MPIGDPLPYNRYQLSYRVEAQHVLGESFQFTIGPAGFVQDEANADTVAQEVVDMLTASPNFTNIRGYKNIDDTIAEITPTP